MKCKSLSISICPFKFLPDFRHSYLISGIPGAPAPTPSNEAATAEGEEVEAAADSPSGEVIGKPICSHLDAADQTGVGLFQYKTEDQILHL